MKIISQNVKRIISLILAMLMMLNLSLFVMAEDGVKVTDDIMSAKMYWSDDLQSGEWKDAEGNAIFNVGDFAPGSVIVRYIKVKNEGNLAFSYNLSLSGEAGDLAEVIDVYCKKDVSENVSVDAMTSIGKLNNVIGAGTIFGGNILPVEEVVADTYSGEAVLAVALKMEDGVVSDYMGKATGEFNVVLSVESYNPQDKFEVKFENTSDYLYRVGNEGVVELGSLFKAKDGVSVGNVDVSLTYLDTTSDVSGKYTPDASDWTKATIDFDGTGPVEITIDDDAYANPVSVKVEVVNAKNVTSYSDIANTSCVLLNDISISSGGSCAFTGATLYGNGYTFDVTAGDYTGSEYYSGNYVISLDNARIDNVVIVGAVYTVYGATAKDDYNIATVITKGNSSILNSYISNCSAPVRLLGGHLEIVNTTLKGGNYANLDIRGGSVTLDNVTTINQINGNDKAADGTEVVGLGIVVFYEQVSDATTIEVKNGLTQYNHMSKAKMSELIKDSRLKSFMNEMFGTSCSEVQYTDASGDKWVNTGILSMTENVGDDNVTDVDGFSKAFPTSNGVNAFVTAKKPDAESILKYAPQYVSKRQAEIAPGYDFDYEIKNYVAKTEGSNRYCYHDGDVVRIAFDQDDTFTWDPAILTATKLGKTLDYTVKIDDVDYTGKTITFDASGTHTVEYTYVDNDNYGIDESGNIITYSKTYTKNIVIKVSEIAPEAKHASFTFGSGNVASKSVSIGNDVYVMPDVTGMTGNIRSFTLSGETIYYPVVDAYSSDGKTEHPELASGSWYMCYPVFKNAVAITDYENGGMGAQVTYNSSTTTRPAGLTLSGWTGQYYKGAASSLPSGALTVTEANEDSIFLYASKAGTDVGNEPKNVSGVLCYQSPELSNNARDEQCNIVRYTYEDNAGSTYYYFVGYHMPQMTLSSSCVTADTLVTMADGSQKRIDEVTYEDKLLSWDFYKGEYAAVSPAVIFDHGYGENTVIKLTFEDDSQIKIINLHQFFDVWENKFVTIKEENVESMVGREFIKADGNGYKAVKLKGYEISREYTEAYGIISSLNYNIITEGLLTTDFEEKDLGMHFYFEVGENMTYNKEKMEADIEEYGLYTYKDFEGYITEEFFDAYNAKYLKISVGKGQFTYQGIIDVINKWLIESGDVLPNEVVVEETEPNDEPDIVPYTEDEPEIIEAEPQTKTIVSIGNKITAASYEVTVSSEQISENNIKYTLTATGTASTGYAIVSIDNDTYYTVQIAPGESITIDVDNLENAKDKVFAVSSDWGTSAVDGIGQEDLLADGAKIDFGTFSIQSIEGASVTLLNTTKYIVEADVYLAVYVGKALYAARKCPNVSIEKDFTFAPDDITLPENATVRAFVWEVGGMCPIITSN